MQGQHNSWEGAQGTEEMEARYGSLKDECTVRKKKTYIVLEILKAEEENIRER